MVMTQRVALGGLQCRCMGVYGGFVRRTSGGRGPVVRPPNARICKQSTISNRNSDVRKEHQINVLRAWLTLPHTWHGLVKRLSKDCSHDCGM